MKNIGVFVSGNFKFLEVKFTIYLNRSVFIMVIMVDYLLQHREIRSIVFYFQIEIYNLFASISTWTKMFILFLI